MLPLKMLGSHMHVSLSDHSISVAQQYRRVKIDHGRHEHNKLESHKYQFSKN